MSLEKAKKDYEIAQILIKEPDDRHFDGACYHIQQAIEKGLKTYIELKGVKPDWTYDIQVLYNKCVKLGLKENLDLDLIAGTLTLWENTSRYNEYFVGNKQVFDKAVKSYIWLEKEIITLKQEMEEKEYNRIFELLEEET